MPRLTAKDFAPELLELYDYYAHGKINRREFLDRAALFTLGGLTASALLAALSPIQKLSPVDLAVGVVVVQFEQFRSKVFRSETGHLCASSWAGR